MYEYLSTYVLIHVRICKYMDTTNQGQLNEFPGSLVHVMFIIIDWEFQYLLNRTILKTHDIHGSMHRSAIHIENPTRCNSVSRHISYLHEAQSVSGDTPPIIRSLKLH
jgi:predicted SAM-dependent methyltransferase